MTLLVRTVRFLVVFLVIVAGTVAGSSQSLSAGSLGEKTVRVLSIGGNLVDSLSPGDTASLYIRDGGLGGVATSTGTWVDIPATVDAGTVWNVADGSPHPAKYSIATGSSYDTTTPSTTPLVLFSSPWVATVDGTPTLITDFTASTGEIKLLTDADQGSTVQIVFNFDQPDLFTEADQLAKAASSSDAAGEWVAMSEVVSETDASPSPASGLFRGQVQLSGDPASTASGDGAVWVRVGDTLTASYREVGGATTVDSHAVSVAAASTPTPVPAVGPAVLGVLAGVFVILTAVMLLRRPPARG